MNVIVVLGHQKKGSFNHAIADVVTRTLREIGHTVRFHDLYEEGFDPVLTDEEINLLDNALPEPVRTHQQEIAESEGLILIHPNWWGGPPAMLRGWLDRVFRNGFAYRFGKTGPVPLFGEKTVQVFSTSNTPREVEIKVYNDPLESFWKTIVFGLCGCKSFERRNFESIIMSTPEERTAWLREVEETVRRRFSVT